MRLVSPVCPRESRAANRFQSWLNSRAALAATEFARESGRDEAFEERIYRAYFNDGENIGDASVVARLAGEADWSVSNTWISDAPQVALFRLEPKQAAAPNPDYVDHDK